MKIKEIIKKICRFGKLKLAVCLLIGILIGYFTEVYTSDTHRSVMKIAKQSETGTATNIIPNHP